MADGPIISIEHLEKRFSGKNADVFALRGIDLAIGRGDIFGIIGKSGAGKSTLVRCINMLERPTAGSVFFEGRDLCRLPEAALRKARRSMGMIFQQFNLLMQRTALQNVCFPLELTGAPRDSILALIKDINVQLGITAVVITHEMSVIEKICSHVAIISKGVIVEQGLVEDVFFHPRTEAARRLVLPEALRRLPQPNLYRLIFNGRSSFEPVIANMVLECGCPVNIMYADTRDINGVAFGQMVLQLPEREESRARIMAFAEAHSIMLEEMKHV